MSGGPLRQLGGAPPPSLCKLVGRVHRDRAWCRDGGESRVHWRLWKNRCTQPLACYSACNGSLPSEFLSISCKTKPPTHRLPTSKPKNRCAFAIVPCSSHPPHPLLPHYRFMLKPPTPPSSSVATMPQIGASVWMSDVLPVSERSLAIVQDRREVR